MVDNSTAYETLRMCDLDILADPQFQGSCRSCEAN